METDQNARNRTTIAVDRALAADLAAAKIRGGYSSMSDVISDNIDLSEFSGE